jgi:hypothetical protein
MDASVNGLFVVGNRTLLETLPGLPVSIHDILHLIDLTLQNLSSPTLVVCRHQGPQAG